jgi:hypothetical protein
VTVVKTDLPIYEYFLMISAKNIWQNTDAPLHVGLLVLNDSNMLSLAAAVDPMRACNRRADRVLFSWQFLAQGGQEVSLTSGMVLQTEDISGFIGDLLILVAGFGLEQHSTPVKWSCKIGQSVKVYSNLMKEYRNDETTEVFRPVLGQGCA